MGTLISAIVAEHGVEGYRSMKLAIAAAAAAKNATLTRDGFTPNQRVFGSECRWPSLNDEECAPSFAEAVGTESEVARSHRMRTTARIALLRQDVREKMRRAILRKPATSPGPFSPGTQVYFWTPGVKSRYSKTRGSVWRGPGTVLVQEKNKRYFVSWRGRLLLLAEENLRLATAEELALTEPVRDETLDLQGMLRDPSRSNTYQDLRDLKPPPRQQRKRKKVQFEETEERKRAKKMMKGTKSVRSLLGDPGKRAAQVRRFGPRRKRVRVEPPAPVAQDVPDNRDYSPSINPEPEEPAQPDDVPGEDVVGEDEREAEPPAPAAPEVQFPPEERSGDEREPGGDQESEEDPFAEVERHEEEERVRAAVRAEWETIPGEQRRQRLEDDVPVSVKRKLADRNDEDMHFMPEKRQRVHPGLVATVVKGVSDDGPANEWITKYELAILRQLTGLPLTAARLHRARRKKFMRPPKSVARSRLTVLIGKDPVDESQKDVNASPRRKASFWWRGITMFARPPEKTQKEQLVPTYVEGEKGLFEVMLTQEERKIFEEVWVQDTRNRLVAEILLLKLKQSGKELDPKAFNKEEAAKFEISDRKEWEQWIDNAVMRPIPAAEEKDIPRHKIFRSPLRMP